MLNTPLKQRRPNDVAGGIGGMDKSARGYLRQIADGEKTFQQGSILQKFNSAENFLDEFSSLNFGKDFRLKTKVVKFI
jgi:hypothetical protein